MSKVMIKDILTERACGDGAEWKRGFTKQEAKRELKWLSPYVRDLKRIIKKEDV